MSRFDDVKQIPPFELKVVVRPVGFDQEDVRAHNGEYGVSVFYKSDDREITVEMSSNGPDLLDVIRNAIAEMLEKIAAK